MASNRGVVFLGPNHVEVQSIDYPKLENPKGQKTPRLDLGSRTWFSVKQDERPVRLNTTNEFKYSS